MIASPPVDPSVVAGNNKAANCLNTMAVTRAAMGEAAFAKLAEALPQACRDMLQKRWLTIEWVPLAQWIVFLEAVCDAHDRDEARMFALARQWADADFNGVYKFFLRFGSPGFILGRTAKVWSTYYDTGELKIVGDEQKGGARTLHMRLENFAPWPLFAYNLHAFIVHVLTLSGAKDLHVERGTPVIEHALLRCDYTVSYA
jgi:hypothetical protein